MKTFACLLLCFLGFQLPGVEGQPVYSLDWKKELALTGAGGIALGLGMHLENRTTLFTPNELETLDPAGINAFDRIATGFHSVQAHRASNYVFYGSFSLPLLLLAGKEPRDDFGVIAALWGETLALNAGATMLSKHSFRRPRPFVFDENVGMSRKLTSNAKASFISGHTSMTAANAFFAAKIFTDYYPESRWKPVVWGVAATLPALTGYLRVRAGRHYPTDVIGGYAVGALIGWGVPQLHRDKALKERGLSIGGGMSGIWVGWEF